MNFADIVKEAVCVEHDPTKTERSRQTSPSRKNQSPSGHVGEDLPVNEDDGVADLSTATAQGALRPVPGWIPHCLI
jgi:hypothetical protein